MWWYQSWSLLPSSPRSTSATNARRTIRPSATIAPSASGSLRRSAGRGDDRRIATGALAARGHVARLVVLLFDVHGPDVVVGSEQVLHGEHGREHRVVLVVVLVHPVAAH